MKIQLAHIVAAAVAAIGLTLSTVDSRAAEKDIVYTAVTAGQFKTLAAALGAADLVDTLKGSGPFTVFAPTDEAFAKLPAGTVESLLKPENKEQLVAILTCRLSLPHPATAAARAGAAPNYAVFWVFDEEERQVLQVIQLDSPDALDTAPLWLCGIPAPALCRLFHRTNP